MYIYIYIIYIYITYIYIYYTNIIVYSTHYYDRYYYVKAATQDAEEGDVTASWSRPGRPAGPSGFVSLSRARSRVERGRPVRPESTCLGGTQGLPRNGGRK